MSEIKDWCTEDAFKMHTDNGLFDDLEKAPTLSFDDAEQQLRQFLKTWLPINEDCIIDLHLAGATLFLDRTIIERYHPYLVETLRHRTLDVSSVALALGLDFEASSFSGLSPKRPHRAEADVLESISRYKAIKAMVGELNKDVSSLNSFKALNFPVN